eukprot:CAMPEP_0197525436 /NCGR_PEP_ID=MMETSP1318-20131121/12093_1 /TAXON_ID=552666 /ORGANISM="Partenskyella glossopodia, Strain RCC365" /LENGTH=111 /DNA_ID=CAMNT_0043078857 /DNA_START=459 /DNA_END=790 /DNA_ORIENTATION=+
MAALIAGLYRSIPYSPGVDIATGLGVGQAIVILYMDMGGAVFIHYRTCNPDHGEYSAVAARRRTADKQKSKSSGGVNQDLKMPSSPAAGMRNNKRRYYRKARIELFEDVYR